LQTEINLVVAGTNWPNFGEQILELKVFNGVG
jgi:hypothetical protein